MKRIAVQAAFVLAALFVSGIASAQTPQLTRQCVGTAGSCVPVSAAAPLPVAATITPGGTQNVNLTQILSAAPSLTNPLWVTPATGATFTTQPAGQTFTNITTSTDTVIKASAGTFVGLSINTIGTTSTATVYNNTTCTGAKIGTYSTILQNSLTINAAATVGICVTTAGGAPADITVLWR